jgi:hypothetical protein
MIEDISVGQRITVFGKLNDGETELDATAGHVGLLLTTVKGIVVNADGSSVILELTGIDGRKIDLFIFAGTGDGTDADPENCKLDTDSLDISGLERADVVKLRGFVTAFGHAGGEANFVARTLVNASNVKGLMIANWNPAATDAIMFESNFDMTLDLSGISLFHHLNRAGVVTDLNELPDALTVEPLGSNNGLFQIVQAGRRQVFFTCTDFADELAELLTQSRVTHIAATSIFYTSQVKVKSDFISH